MTIFRRGIPKGPLVTAAAGAVRGFYSAAENFPSRPFTGEALSTFPARRSSLAAVRPRFSRANRLVEIASPFGAKAVECCRRELSAEVGREFVQRLHLNRGVAGSREKRHRRPQDSNQQRTA